MRSCKVIVVKQVSRIFYIFVCMNIELYLRNTHCIYKNKIKSGFFSANG